jgi:hypothetical protein
MRRKINTAFDDHDYDQLKLLAKLNRIKVTELVRRLCKAHLDKSRANLREERINER